MDLAEFMVNTYSVEAILLAMIFEYYCSQKHQYLFEQAAISQAN